MGEGTWHVRRRDVYWVLVGKPEGKMPLGRPGCKWEYNIKTDLQEIGSKYLALFDTAEHRIL